MGLSVISSSPLIIIITLQEVPGNTGLEAETYMQDDSDQLFHKNSEKKETDPVIKIPNDAASTEVGCLIEETPEEMFVPSGSAHVSVKYF